MSRTEEFYQDCMIYIDRELEVSSLEEGNSKENIFTARILDDLSSGNTPVLKGLSSEVFRYENSNTKSRINGFYIDDVENSITVYVTHFETQHMPYPLLSSTVDSELRSLDNLMKRIQKSPEEMLTMIEEDEPLYELVYILAHHMDEYQSFTYVLLTNGSVREINLPKFTFNKRKVEVVVYDIERYRRFMDGQKVVEIKADLSILGRPVPCVSIIDSCEDYDSYCCILPGQVIYNLFDTYHYQLLNSNVRTYLQLRGSVNQGIMNTIHDAPENFLAYNNGISATASQVKMNEKGEIIELNDFQIVNGGQTSASIYNAKDQKGYSIDKIWVQTKITVIKNEKQRDMIVKNISRYANSQNAIKFSDFSSNDKYNTELARLSRSTYSPIQGSKLQTKWYYQNVGGSYNIEKSDLGRAFEKEYPKNQFFSKTDMAAYELAYQGFPVEASKGAQDAYRIFVINLPALNLPTEKDFKRLIAKKILFDTTLNVIKEDIGGQGRKAMTCYVVAYLSTIICNNKLNLDAIWDAQAVSQSLLEDIRNLAYQMCSYLRDSAIKKKLSVDMHCRRKTTWELITQDKQFTVENPTLYTGTEELVPVLRNRLLNIKHAKILESIDPKLWIDLSTNCEMIANGNKKSLNAHSKMCITMATNKLNTFSEKQLVYALRILTLFYQKGYKFPQLVDVMISSNEEDLNSFVFESLARYSKETYFTQSN